MRYGNHEELDQKYGIKIKQKDLPAWEEAQLTWYVDALQRRHESRLGRLLHPIAKAISDWWTARDRAKHPEKYQLRPWQDVRDDMGIDAYQHETDFVRMRERLFREEEAEREAWEKTLDGQTIEDQMEEKRQKAKVRTGKKIKKA